MTDLEMLRRQLRAIADLADNALGMLDGEAPASAPIAPHACEHPASARVPAGVMGAESQFFCKACESLVRGS